MAYVGGDFAGANAATLTLTIPAGAVADQFACIAWIYADAQTGTNPAGWTQHTDAVVGNARYRLLTRVVQSGDASTDVTLTNSGANRQTAVLWVDDGIGIDAATPAHITDETTVTTRTMPATTIAGDRTVYPVVLSRGNATLTSWTPSVGTTRQDAYTGGSGATSGAVASIDATAGSVGGGTWTSDVADLRAVTMLIVADPVVVIPPAPAGPSFVPLPASERATIHDDTTTLSGLTDLEWLGEPTSGGLIVASATHAHAATSPTLTQHHTLTVADAAHAHAATSPTLVQHHALTVAGAAHAHTATNVTLTAYTPGGTVAPDSATHTHAATSPTLTQHQVLAPASATHAVTSTGPTLTQHQSLTVASATHTHAATGPVLTQHHILTAAAATHTHTATSPTLTQHHALVVAGGTHAHVVTSPTLAARYALTVNDGAHGHSATSPGLTQHHVLAVADAWHGHLATSPTVTPTADPAAPTPDTRRRIILAEVRTRTVPTDPRRTIVAAEHRTATITADTRTRTIPTEHRTTEAS